MWSCGHGPYVIVTAVLICWVQTTGTTTVASQTSSPSPTADGTSTSGSVGGTSSNDTTDGDEQIFMQDNDTSTAPSMVSSKANDTVAQTPTSLSTQIIIIIGACGGGLLLVALVGSLVYVKLRLKKRRRVRVTTTGPTQDQVNTAEVGDQIVDA